MIRITDEQRGNLRSLLSILHEAADPSFAAALWLHPSDVLGVGSYEELVCGLFDDRMIEDALGASTVFGVEVGSAAPCLRAFVEKLERFEQKRVQRTGTDQPADSDILSDASWREVVKSARVARLELSKALAEGQR